MAESGDSNCDVWYYIGINKTETKPEAEFMNIQFSLGFQGKNLRVLGLEVHICFVFLKHRKGDIVFYQIFLLSPLQCTVTELEKL